jgi:hypothetical protein
MFQSDDRHPDAQAEELAPEAEVSTGGGWITDLVKRASRHDASQDSVEKVKAPSEPVAQSPLVTRTVPETGSVSSTLPASRGMAIDTITSDIARMMDHQAVVDAWDAYFKGERNPFTRRLYSLRGLQTLDEMQRNWRRDPVFRETLTRYTEEFERLLTEVAQSDSDHAVAKSYLTSDTGKVYTMLAHASGRFDKA